jgi:hypothetical protein
VFFEILIRRINLGTGPTAENKFPHTKRPAARNGLLATGFRFGLNALLAQGLQCLRKELNIMKILASISFCILIYGGMKAQELVLQKLPKITVDDKSSGYTLFTYEIPSDGYYTFALDGGMLPKSSCTIYYCEYLLQLKAGNKVYHQDQLNIASQAQDGDICNFKSNDKNNSVSGVFSKGDRVELRLVLHKSDVNGQPHKELNIAQNSLVSVTQVTPGYQQQ